ncbi:hypothetical protein BDF21DRAFT_492838 [Thamnidium elegans]|nr:hypothetical protein BDF21DRAFT_492838 [Thamnidium elegans]
MNCNTMPEASVSTPNIINNETRNGLLFPCENCKKDQLSCNSTIPCSSCISRGKSDNCTIITTVPKAQPETTKTTTSPAKRGYKSHVPSACSNCKIAHLACDVSRPCQRCITLKKADTCQDMQHKKRGRPKLRDKKVYSSNEHNYKILYGTIQTPSISANSSNNRNIVPNIQAPPFKGKLQNTVKRPPAISFIHEPIESFQSTHHSLLDTHNQQDIPRIHLAYDYNTNNMLLDALPTTQLSSVLLPPQQQQQQQQHTIFDYSNNITNPILLNNGNNSNIITNFETKNDSIVDENLTIIMSMEVCCAKVSNDTIKCWGYYPQELAHRSFYDFISPKDSDRLARLHRLLLDNAMDTIKNTASASPLPPTERTTSSLFSNTDQTILSVIANGSRSFSDSIHIKKRCGEYELYKVVVYIGGGLGADLYDITSFSKQYIVAQFRKHEYEVIPPSVTSSVLSPDDLSNNTESCYQNIEPIAVFSPMSPLSPSSPNIAYSNASTTVTATTITTTNNNNNNNNNNNYAKLEMFKNYNSRSLFSHTRKDHKPLSATTKFSQMSIIPPCSPPKFNIAPITTQHQSNTKHYNSSFLSRFPPSASSSTAGPSSSVAVPVSSLRLRTTDRPTVTHPTQQYFLQTSSSSLNAAASAAANSNKARRSISGPTTSESPSTNNQKMEMSIRSLLC